MRDCGSQEEPAVQHALEILNIDFSDFALRVAGQIHAAETYCRIDFDALGKRLFAATERIARLCAEVDPQWQCVPAVAGAQFSGQIAIYRDSIDGNLPSGIANGCVRLQVMLDRDRPEVADNIEALERSLVVQARLAERLQADRPMLARYCAAKARGVAVDPQSGMAPPPRRPVGATQDE